jgi:hypothetical protein
MKRQMAWKTLLLEGRGHGRLGSMVHYGVSSFLLSSNICSIIVLISSDESRALAAISHPGYALWQVQRTFDCRFAWKLS